MRYDAQAIQEMLALTQQYLAELCQQRADFEQQRAAASRLIREGAALAEHAARRLRRC